MIFFESLCMLKSGKPIQVEIVSLKEKFSIFHLRDALDRLHDALGDCNQCNLTPARCTE